MKNLTFIFFAIFALLSSSLISVNNAQTTEACTFCKFLIKFMNVVLQNGGVAHVQEEVKEICSYVDSNQSVCYEMIYGNLTKVIDLIKSGESDQDICNHFNYCPLDGSSSEANIIDFSAPITELIINEMIINAVERLNNGSQPVDCALCEFLVDEIELYVPINATETDVENFLNNECTVIFGSLAKNCQNIVDAYAGKIIALINENDKPSYVCSQIQLCSSNSNIYNLKKLIKKLI